MVFPGAYGGRDLLFAVILPVLLAGPFRAAAQAVSRADLPPAGALRLTIDPRIAFWDESFRNGTRQSLGAFLSGDSLGGVENPQLARLDQDLAIATGATTFLSNLGAAVLALRAERRVMPVGLEFGLGRLSLGVRVPVVRVQTRAGFTLDSTASNLGRNPRGVLPGADSLYNDFFGDFDAALTQLRANINGGSYGCPGSPQCAAAQAFADSAAAVRDALRRSALGAGSGDAAPFLPTGGSAAGTAIAANVTRIQQTLATTWSVAGFNGSFLLPTVRASAADVRALIAADAPGFGAQPLQGTRQALRFWLGDVEIEGRYALVRTVGYHATVGALVRLPTGHQDSPHNLFDLGSGDGQLDIEGQLTQELVLGHVWLNAALRAGVQTPGERERRVAPQDVLLVPRAATALLDWDPGNYFALDVAPLYRLNPAFATGPTLSITGQSEDRYSFRAAADSLAIATALGAPVPAGVLDAGTAITTTRVGWAVTYAGPALEGSFVMERVVSGRGGTTPALTNVRILLRTARRLF